MPTETTNLAILGIDSSQSQQDVIVNEALEDFDAAITETVSIVSSDAVVTVSAAHFRGAQRLRLTPGATGAWELTLPSVKRLTMLTNDSGYDVDVTSAGDTGGSPVPLTIPDGVSMMVYSDGMFLVEITAQALGAVNYFTDLGDVPIAYTGAALKALRVNVAETAVEFVSEPFDATTFYPGIPSASAILLRVPIARAVSFPANFAGSYFTATANATGSTVFDVQKNGVSVGTVTIGAGGTTATFATSGGAAQSFASGDVLAIIAPGSPDATLANPAFVLAGIR